METRKGVMRAQAAQLVEALNARDFDAMAGMPLDPELEFRSIIAASEGTSYRGIEGLRQWARDVDAIWENVLVMRVTGRARGSGVPLESTIGQVWHWREGKLWLNDAYSDPRDTFAAAGIEPLPQ